MVLTSESRASSLVLACVLLFPSPQTTAWVLLPVLGWSLRIQRQSPREVLQLSEVGGHIVGCGTHILFPPGTFIQKGHPSVVSESIQKVFSAESPRLQAVGS